MEVSKEDSKASKFWLYSFRNHLAGIQSFTNSCDLADVYGDGDYKFLVSNGNRRLKVFGGTTLETEMRLLSVPSAMTTFYADSSDVIQRPVVAIACGPYVFMFRNMRPLYRFTVPSVELDPVDVAVWDSLRSGTLPVFEAAEMLEDRRRNGIELSTRSTDLLASDNGQDREAFVARVKDEPLRQMTFVVCMTSIFLDRTEDKSRSCLVFGTENQYLYVLRSSASEVKLRLKLASVPVCIITAGALNVDYRIIVACRDGCVYSVKHGRLSTSVIRADARIVQIARYDNLVAVATTRNTLTFYNLKGKQNGCAFLPCPILSIVTITEPVSGKARGVVVALNNATIRVYVGKLFLHETPTYHNVTTMHFGRYGREDSALILGLQNGSLVVQMLHRHASFECDKSHRVGPPPEQDIPIPVPPLTSVFVAQAERERLYSADMHQSFQRDLCRLRLGTANSYLKIITSSGDNRVNGGAVASSASTHKLDTSLRMVTAVQGLGPLFKLRVTIQNVSPMTMYRLLILLTYSSLAFRSPTPIVEVPFLAPGLLHTIDILIERLISADNEEDVHVHVCNPSHRSSLASTLVNLPETDILDEEM